MPLKANRGSRQQWRRKLACLHSPFVPSGLQTIAARLHVNKKWFWLFGACYLADGAARQETFAAAAWFCLQALKPTIAHIAPLHCAPGATCFFSYLYVRPTIRRRLGSASRCPSMAGAPPPPPPQAAPSQPPCQLVLFRRAGSVQPLLLRDAFWRIPIFSMCSSWASKRKPTTAASCLAWPNMPLPLPPAPCSGYINWSTAYILWLLSAVFYHLPSLQVEEGGEGGSASLRAAAAAAAVASAQRAPPPRVACEAAAIARLALWAAAAARTTHISVPVAVPGHRRARRRLAAADDLSGDHGCGTGARGRGAGSSLWCWRPGSPRLPPPPPSVSQSLAQ